MTSHNHRFDRDINLTIETPFAFVKMLRRLGCLKNQTLTERLFKNRTIDVSLELDMVHLNVILREVIRHYSTDKEIITTGRMVSSHISSVNRKIGKLSVGGLDQIASVLETFLSSTEDLPAPIVAYVHTYLGLIRERQRRYDEAIDSLVKALWIRKSANESDINIAVASHRLGISYSHAGDYRNASAALRRALQYYARGNLANNHRFVLSAANRLEAFRLQRKSSKSSRLKDSVVTNRTDASTAFASSWSESVGCW